MAAGDPRSASVVDVAAEAGVSLGTVSNVLNRPERVSDKTRLRVEEAMARLGFVRNESARQLRAGHSRTLAYVMLDVGNPFFTDVADGMDVVAQERDLSLFLCNSANDAQREAAYLHHLRQQRVQGILVTPVDPYSPLLDEIVKQTPVVIVDRRREDGTFCSASADDVAGGRLAAEHLLDRGHRRIAFVGGPEGLGQVRERREGALLAIREAGLPDTALVTVDTAGLGFGDGRQAGERLLGMASARRPSAAFCANDLVALGLLQQVSISGRSVPDDLAIVGFDDIDFAGAAAVPLTSVRQPRRELGRTAAEMLLDEAANPDHEHRQVSFAPELVARASSL